MMKKLSSDDFPFSHYVDEENKVVYVNVRSFMGSMGAHVRGKQVWPDYEIINVSDETLQDKLNNA